ncbi:MAG: hypothetical protein JOZ10_11905 [Acidobacteria bacterium]|nr:hypothetical protein [Acidobacteriota bacterium]
MKKFFPRLTPVGYQSTALRAIYEAYCGRRYGLPKLGLFTYSAQNLCIAAG